MAGVIHGNPPMVLAWVWLVSMAGAIFTGAFSFRRDVPRRLMIAVAVTLTVPVGIIVYFLWNLKYVT
jgi:hypothetical protein